MDSSTKINQIEKQVESAVDEIVKHHEIKEGKREIVFDRIFNRERHTFQKNHNLPVGPEKFIIQVLVKDLIPILGYEYSGAKKVTEGSEPDFKITTTNKPILGEVKPPGEIYQAYGQMIRYFDSTEYDYGFITDGLYWELLKCEESPGIVSGTTVKHGELRGFVAKYVRENDIVDNSVIKLGDDISPTSPAEFYSDFNIHSINDIL